MEHRFNKILFYFIVLIFYSCNNVEKNNEYNELKKEKASCQKLLMIGNSFTFYWNLPQVLESMFDSSNINIEVYQKTIGGSKLKEHWYYNKMEDYNIKDYDFIVLNDHSTYPLNNVDTCSKYISLFSNYINNYNIKTYVYGTWEYPLLKNISPLRYSNTMQILDSLSILNNAVYIPVGNAFKYLENNFPQINLYMDDNKHPSPNATYLAACVFYSMISGKSPVGLPRRFLGENIDGKKIYYILTEKKTCKILQNVAELITAVKK